MFKIFLLTFRLSRMKIVVLALFFEVRDKRLGDGSEIEVDSCSTDQNSWVWGSILTAFCYFFIFQARKLLFWGDVHELLSSNGRPSWIFKICHSAMKSWVFKVFHYLDFLGPNQLVQREIHRVTRSKRMPHIYIYIWVILVDFAISVRRWYSEINPKPYNFEVLYKIWTFAKY